MEMEGIGAPKGDPIGDVPNRHMYYKETCIMEATNPEWSNWDKFNNKLRSIEPVNELATMVKRWEAKCIGLVSGVVLHRKQNTEKYTGHKREGYECVTSKRSDAR